MKITTRVDQENILCGDYLTRAATRYFSLKDDKFVQCLVKITQVHTTAHLLLLIDVE